MTCVLTFLRRGFATLLAHPRLTFVVAWVLTALYHPHVSHLVYLIGAIQLDDVNTITTKDIMPGVAD